MNDKEMNDQELRWFLQRIKWIKWTAMLGLASSLCALLIIWVIIAPIIFGQPTCGEVV